MVANGHQKTCPTCGQTLPRPKPHGLRLSPLRTRLFEIVRRAGPEGIGTDDLMDMVYAQHPDGGPDSGRVCLRTHIFHINQQLRQKGYEIKARNWGRVSRGDFGCGTYVYQQVSP